MEQYDRQFGSVQAIRERNGSHCLRKLKKKAERTSKNRLKAQKEWRSKQNRMRSSSRKRSRSKKGNKMNYNPSARK